MATIETENACQRTLHQCRSRNILIVGLVIAMLAGCAGGPGPRSDTASPAAAAYAAGDYEKAWQLYNTRAQRSGANADQLKAADSAILTGRFEQADG